MDIQQSLTAIFEPAEEGGFIAYIAEIEGANSQGETLEEAKANLLEALEMILDVRRELAQKNAKPINVYQEKIQLVA
jgi:predicted RNase H-like HicB family nuclease